MGRDSTFARVGFVLVTLAAFAYGGWQLVVSNRDADISARQATTAGKVVLHHVSRAHRSTGSSLRWVCDYSFQLSGNTYFRTGDCPSTNDSSGFREIAEVTQQANVYLDPAHPDTSSLIEFKEQSKRDRWWALVSFLLGALGVMLNILGVVPDRNRDCERHRVCRSDGCSYAPGYKRRARPN